MDQDINADQGASPSRTAACACGQLSIKVFGEPRSIGVCHCLACQRRTGSVFAAGASFAPPYVATGKASEYVRVGDQGARFRFRFCPVCGSNLFQTEEGFEDRSVSVAVGCFADPAFPPPRASVYDARRHGWVQLPLDVKVYPGDPP